jgi:hypothetical protein
MVENYSKILILIGKIKFQIILKKPFFDSAIILFFFIFVA